MLRLGTTYSERQVKSNSIRPVADFLDLSMDNLVEAKRWFANGGACQTRVLTCR
jgi:hypothetical protein